MTRHILNDPEAEHRLQEVERLLRIHVAGVLERGRGGVVLIRIVVGPGPVARISTETRVELEENVLTRRGA